MTERHTEPESSPVSSWMAAIAYRALWGLCAAVGVADFFYEKHVSHRIEEFPAFYGLFAFLVVVGMALVAKGVRDVVRRREDYYDR